MSVKYTPSSENTNGSFISPIPFNTLQQIILVLFYLREPDSPPLVLLNLVCVQH